VTSFGDHQFHVPAPNWLWWPTFAYASTWTGFVYVAVVIDAGPRRCAGLRLDRAAFDAARAAHRAAARTGFDRVRLADAAKKIEKAAFTRADLIEILGAHFPVNCEQSP
jgi:transposase InsO family protein